VIEAGLLDNPDVFAKMLKFRNAVSHRQWAKYTTFRSELDPIARAAAVGRRAKAKKVKPEEEWNNDGVET
jgi:hypothetical protein